MSLYIPEMLTPLFHTPWYEKLSPAERLSYNRLHGMYFLEQTIFFEQVMGKPALRQLIRLAPDEALAKEARDFMREEDTHTSWFRALLREENPAAYERQDFVLLGAPSFLRLAMAMGARAIRWLPSLLWLQLIAEERALYYGRCFIAHADSLDARFLAVQRKHLADEPSHIRRDELFLNWMWPSSGSLKRRANARFLRWLLTEFFYIPKRSGWRVVEVWLELNPRWLGQKRDFHRTMMQLGENQGYVHTLYPKKHLGHTLKLAEPWPELNFLRELFTDDPGKVAKGFHPFIQSEKSGKD